MLQAAGFELEFTEDTQALLWGKLVINAAINPLSAILSVPNGKLLDLEPIVTLIDKSVKESAAVTAALQIHLPYEDPFLAVKSVALLTANNRSSMLQDIQRGRQTEIEAINGAIVKAGSQVGVQTPIHQTLWLIVSALSGLSPAETKSFSHSPR